MRLRDLFWVNSSSSVAHNSHPRHATLFIHIYPVPGPSTFKHRISASNNDLTGNWGVHKTLTKLYLLLVAISCLGKPFRYLSKLCKHTDFHLVAYLIKFGAWKRSRNTKSLTYSCTIDGRYGEWPPVGKGEAEHFWGLEEGQEQEFTLWSSRQCFDHWILAHLQGIQSYQLESLAWELSMCWSAPKALEGQAYRL